MGKLSFERRIFPYLYKRKTSSFEDKMKISEVAKIDEIRYPGNVGVMEMVKFYQVATEEQKILMKKLIAENRTEEAWQLLQQVSGTKLD